MCVKPTAAARFPDLHDRLWLLESANRLKLKQHMPIYGSGSDLSSARNPAPAGPSHSFSRSSMLASFQQSSWSGRK